MSESAETIPLSVPSTSASGKHPRHSVNSQASPKLQYLTSQGHHYSKQSFICNVFFSLDLSILNVDIPRRLKIIPFKILARKMFILQESC